MPTSTSKQMKYSHIVLLLLLPGSLFFFDGCNKTTKEETPLKSYRSASTVASGTPVAVMFTPYSTVLRADGKDQTFLRIALTDSTGREIGNASDSVRIYIDGEAQILTTEENIVESRMDQQGREYHPARLENGLCRLILRTTDMPGTMGVEVRVGTLASVSHEIHTVLPDFTYLTPAATQLPESTRPVGRMIGADVSFLPQLEADGMRFYDGGQETDALEMLRNHGFNFIRLRIFVNPEHADGYAPGEGYCGLDHTLAMARRIKEAGMGFLLNFHYSDYWADPGKQHKPAAWEGLSFEVLKDSVKEYTAHVLRSMEKQGTLPDMVQTGNEINHGILWPDGHISYPDQLAALLRAGVEGCREVSTEIPVMMHLALGGQQQEAVFWLDNMIAREVAFDIIGISYYPQWHGTLDDLNLNLHELVKRYQLPVNVVEYSRFIPEVHEIVFGLPGDKGKGTCIWEPLGWTGPLTDEDGHTTQAIRMYRDMHALYLARPTASRD